MDGLILPAPELQAFVEGYWLRSGLYDPPKKVRVLADACTKVIFELTPMPWPPCYVIATQMSPIIVELSGKVDRIGIRFRPGAATFFLKHSFDRIPRGLADFASLELQEGPELLACLRGTPDASARATILDQWLLTRCPTSAAESADIETALKLAGLLRDGLAPPAIAAALRWSERRLQRLCRRWFGASAASLHRLYRFELTQKRLKEEGTALAGLAAELGYSDQAHMSREFRHFADTNISAFNRERAPVGNLQDQGEWLPVLRTVEET